ncbi:MAG: HK97 family phage prohead protease [Polyangiaceae bacterium]|nr:HK97 family phage prohead protease [Polyangiaceae bacterium]
MIRREAPARLYCRATIERRDAGAAKAASRSLSVVASTEAVDAHGSRVLQNWRIDRYLANPVVLWAHDSSEMPVGLASNVRVEKGRLLADIELAAEGISARADEVWMGIQAGLVRGVSVGFVPHSVRSVTEQDVDVLELDDNELIEISLTPTPSNAEALAQLRTAARREGQTMNFKLLIIRALGLSESASDADIAAALEQRVGTLREVEALVGATGREVVGRAAAWRQSHEQLAQAHATVAELRGELEARKRSSLVADAQQRGQLTGAMLEWARAQPLDVLRSFLAVAPVAVPGAGASPLSPTPPTGVGLSSEDRAVAKLLGLPEEKMLESKRALRAEVI